MSSVIKIDSIDVQEAKDKYIVTINAVSEVKVDLLSINLSVKSSPVSKGSEVRVKPISGKRYKIVSSSLSGYEKYLNRVFEVVLSYEVDGMDVVFDGEESKTFLSWYMCRLEEV